GKYMTARDFREEQMYFRSHHQWHQWSLHGWGIVWGLQVELKGHCLIIHPGMALDCHGRELVLPYSVTIPVSDLGTGPDLLIGLRYAEFERDPVPLLLDDGCPPSKNTHNRIHELAQISWQEYCSKCWTYPPTYLPVHLPTASSSDQHPLCQHQNSDDCGCHPIPVDMIPPCECGPCGFVPLARLTRDKGSWSACDLGRRYVPSPFYGEVLTHIVGVNWTHGGKTPFQQLRNDSKHPTSDKSQKLVEKMHAKCNGNVGRLIIEFDKPLGMTDIGNGCPTSLSTYLSQLMSLHYIELDDQYENHDLDGDDPPQPIALKAMHLSDCRKQLYCDFPAHKVNHHLPVRMRISLNCDLIRDRYGRAVDGEHLGGHVPNLFSRKPDNHARSGNGIEGGVFYSWTELTPG
ncbi:MAG: hypothetical protein WCJ09_22695, partial [Planctomycetota bacterium]